LDQAAYYVRGSFTRATQLSALRIENFPPHNWTLESWQVMLDFRELTSHGPTKTN